MSDELTDIRERCDKSMQSIAEALNVIEHALADTQSPEGADLIRRCIGRGYSLMDRVNGAANSRYWNLTVGRDIAARVLAND